MNFDHLVVNVKSTESVDEYDVFCGRPSKWGNPFLIGRDGDRHTVIGKYRAYLMSNKDLLSEIHTLRGKVLGAFVSLWLVIVTFLLKSQMRLSQASKI